MDLPIKSDSIAAFEVGQRWLGTYDAEGNLSWRQVSAFPDADPSDTDPAFVVTEVDYDNGTVKLSTKGKLRGRIT